MDAFPLVWIVIPAWNRCEDLRLTLQSVQALAYANYQVLVVDNGSTDETLTMLEAEFPWARVLPLGENRGASGASNAGFAHALTNGAVYVLRLDSDVKLAPDFLRELVKVAETRPQVGCLTGKIYYLADPHRIWSTGAQQKRWDLGGVDLGRGQLDGPAHNQERQIDYAWSTGMLLTREALVITGGFDPAFFVYYEEPDLCLRLRQAGLQVWFVPSAHMWHKIGQASRSAWVAYQWNRSKMIFLRKHSRGMHRLLLLFYAYAYALGRSLVPGQGAGNRGPVAAAVSGLTAGLRYRLRNNRPN
ncbi:MAG: glycosyltransferase family 2 protein [Chloroflexi bacterium]|nr:glycosyltransferase family 2 protein [Chloroflexota bacterium]